MARPALLAVPPPPPRRAPIDSNQTRRIRSSPKKLERCVTRCLPRPPSLSDFHLYDLKSNQVINLLRLIHLSQHPYLICAAP